MKLPDFFYKVKTKELQQRTIIYHQNNERPAKCEHIKTVKRF